MGDLHNFPRSIRSKQDLSKETMDVIIEVRDQIISGLGPALRLAGLTSEPQPALPIPNDVEAEKTVIGAVLSQEISIVELDDLHADHMYLGLHRWIFEKAMAASAADVRLTVPILVVSAIDDGIAGEAIREDLNDLTCRPFEHPDRVRECAKRVIRAAEARTLIEQLQAIDLALRTWVRTPEQAKRFLRELGASVE